MRMEKEYFEWSEKRADRKERDGRRKLRSTEQVGTLNTNSRISQFGETQDVKIEYRLIHASVEKILTE